MLSTRRQTAHGARSLGDAYRKELASVLALNCYEERHDNRQAVVRWHATLSTDQLPVSA